MIRALNTYLLCLFSWMLFGQHTPAIVNYRVSEYKAHNQNWSVSQALDETIYLGNTAGLLSFNGNEWNLNKLESNKIIRSVSAVDNKIYTGAHGEFGYWTKNVCGDLAYTSLNSLVPENALANEEIWNIVSINGLIYFQSFSVLMAYDGEKITKISLPGSIMFLHQTNGKLFIQTIGFGIYEIKGLTPLLIKGSSYFNDKIVTGIINLRSLNGSMQLIVSTNSQGVFFLKDQEVRVWNKAFIDYFTEVQVNKMLVTTSGNIVFGTIRDGILIFNPDGKFLYHIHTGNGLQNNTILSITEDQQHNLWLGLDKGICLVNMNEDILFYNDISGKLGTVYSLTENQHILYIGTNQGVYFYDKRKNKGSQSNDFKIIKGTQGQVWQLKNNGDDVICGHNDGTFLIKGIKAIKISEVTGGWFTENVNLNGENVLLQGTYTGLIVFKKLFGNWKFSHRISGFNGPVKKFVVDKEDIWVAGPNTGLTKVTVDKEFKKVVKYIKYDIQQGLSENQNLDLSSLSGFIIVNDGDSNYEYDLSNDIFITSDSNRKDDQYLIRSVDSTSTWFKVYNDSFSVVSKTKQIVTYPFNLNRDYHCVNLLSKHKFGICLSEGYAVLKDTVTSKASILRPLNISKIVLSEEEICIPFDENVETQIKFKDRQFKVYFNDTNFDNNKLYQYRIIPGNMNWSPTTTSYFVDCNNLSSGNYKLEIKGMNKITKSMRFKILSPWYSNKIALFVYLLLGISTLYLLKIYFDKKLNYEKDKLETENQRLLRELKISLENDRLLQDNLSKSKELANATMHLVQKNELLQEIKEELIEVRKKQDHALSTKDFQTIMHQINDNLTIQEDKKLFDANFEDVHAAFFKKLKSAFPDLSGDDLKLAAYLKMNLTSKEIAPLFNISIRGLENKRYRLRKKINLPNEFSLTAFFVNYDNETQGFA